MPQRFLRPGLRTSPRWNAISHEAARLYISILTQVDDFGRYDGRTSVLWSEAFAVWNEQNPQRAVTPQETAGFCEQLAGKLVLFYEVDGRRYLQLLQWEERARGKSKWPEPPAVNPLRNPAESCAILPNPASLAPAIALSHRQEPAPESVEPPPPKAAAAKSPNAALSRPLHMAWNDNSMLPKCLDLSAKRKASINARLNEPFFVANWHLALAKIAKSSFCLGQGDRGWKATFDWFVSRDAVVRVMEGKYDDASPGMCAGKPTKTDAQILQEAIG